MHVKMIKKDTGVRSQNERTWTQAPAPLSLVASLTP
jgi:hypothetical protein